MDSKRLRMIQGLVLSSYQREPSHDGLRSWLRSATASRHRVYHCYYQAQRLPAETAFDQSAHF